MCNHALRLRDAKHIIATTFVVTVMFHMNVALAADEEWLDQLRTAITQFVEQRKFAAATKSAQTALQMCDDAYSTDSWQRRYAKLEFDSYGRASQLPWHERRQLDELLDRLKSLHSQSDVQDWPVHVARLEESVAELERFLGNQCWLVELEFEHLDATYRKVGNYQTSRLLAEKRFRSAFDARGREDPLLARVRLRLARSYLSTSATVQKSSKQLKEVAAYRTQLPLNTQFLLASILSAACEESDLIDAALVWNDECIAILKKDNGDDIELAVILANHAKLQAKNGRSGEAATTLREAERLEERSKSSDSSLLRLISEFRFDMLLADHQGMRAIAEIEKLDLLHRQRCETFPAQANSQFAAALIVRRGLAEEQLGEFGDSKEHLIQGLTQWQERAQGDLPSMMDGMQAIVRVCNHLGCSDEEKRWESTRRALEQRMATHRSELLAITAMFNKGDWPRESRQAER